VPFGGRIKSSKGLFYFYFQRKKKVCFMFKISSSKDYGLMLEIVLSGESWGCPLEIDSLEVKEDFFSYCKQIAYNFFKDKKEEAERVYKKLVDIAAFLDGRKSYGNEYFEKALRSAENDKNYFTKAFESFLKESALASVPSSPPPAPAIKPAPTPEQRANIYEKRIIDILKKDFGF
jgi:hypothetical protein